jgi:hypothetical protein
MDKGEVDHPNTQLRIHATIMSQSRQTSTRQEIDPGAQTRYRILNRDGNPWRGRCRGEIQLPDHGAIDECPCAPASENQVFIHRPFATFGWWVTRASTWGLGRDPSRRRDPADARLRPNSGRASVHARDALLLRGKIPRRDAGGTDLRLPAATAASPSSGLRGIGRIALRWLVTWWVPTWLHDSLEGGLAQTC